MSLTQPLTAKQIAGRTGIAFGPCREAVRDLAAHGLIRCLNRDARSSRLYWLTEQGMACQRKLSRALARSPPVHFVPAIDWPRYGWVCFKHRSTIIKTLSEPMQPATIKRRARARDPNLRMSANNVRDIIQSYRACGIVRPVAGRRKAHARYELTEIGRRFQELLWRAKALA